MILCCVRHSYDENQLEKLCNNGALFINVHIDLAHTELHAETVWARCIDSEGIVSWRIVVQKSLPNNGTRS